MRGSSLVERVRKLVLVIAKVSWAEEVGRYGDIMSSLTKSRDNQGRTTLDEITRNPDKCASGGVDNVTKRAFDGGAIDSYRLDENQYC